MLPKFREALLKIADEFLDYLGIPVDVIDITMTGSYANYNYTPFSDIDLHIVIDFSTVNSDTDLVEEFFSAKKTFWNNRHDIELKNIDVEIYPQKHDEEHASTGVYSVQDNKWVIKPKKFKNQIDVDNVTKKAEKITKEIKVAIKQAKDRNITRPLDKMIKKLKKMRKSGLEKAGELSDENIMYKVIRSQNLLQDLFDTKDEIVDKDLSTIR
jgi:hypothetical protein